MHSDSMINLIGAGGALTLLASVALGIAVMLLHKKLRQMRAELAALAQHMETAQEQHQRELMAMGQRVMEADKLIRRFSDRIDTIENEQPTEMRYGQLDERVSDVTLRDAAPSEAEEKLLALLRRAGG